MVRYITRNHERYDISYEYSRQEVDLLVAELRGIELGRNVDERLERVRAHAAECAVRKLLNLCENRLDKML